MKRILPIGPVRSIESIDYDRNEYRPVIRIDGVIVARGPIGTLTEAVRGTNDLMREYLA